jgi:hypothetical protein
MPDNRTPVKLDFMTPIPTLPTRPKVDPSTTAASVSAAQDIGFLASEPAPNAKAIDKEHSKIDGRKLRRRAQKIQLNLKVYEEEKMMILQLAEEVIEDPNSSIRSVGELVVRAVEAYRDQKLGDANQHRD